MDDLPTEKNEKKKGGKGRKDEMRKRREKEGEGGWRKPSSYDTIDFLSEA